MSNRIIYLTDRKLFAVLLIYALLASLLATSSVFSTLPPVRTVVSELVDMDITSTVTPVTFYPVVYWYKGQALVGYMSGGVGNPNPAVCKWTVSVRRTDANTNVGGLLAVVGIKRVNSTGWLEFCNATTVILAPGGSASAPIEWWEDGTLSQNFAPGIWILTGVINAVTSNAQDANTANNEIAAGSMQARGPLAGDILIDGIVDIFDAIQFSGAWGTSEGESAYRSECNFHYGPDSVTGKQVIDLFDAIILSSNFNKHIP